MRAAGEALLVCVVKRWTPRRRRPAGRLYRRDQRLPLLRTVADYRGAFSTMHRNEAACPRGLTLSVLGSATFELKENIAVRTLY